MFTTAKSHVKANGKVFFKNTGRSTELTKSAIKKVINDAPSSFKQKKLVLEDKDCAAALILLDLKKEFDL